MVDFLDKDKPEALTSRYQQQRTPIEEGSESRKDGESKGKIVPDSKIVYNSAGGKVPEKNIKPQLEAGEYGKVRVITETHAGHVIMVDETVGNERIYILHPNGTYTNIEPNLKTDKSETDSFQFVHGDLKMEVSDDHIEFIHKNHKVEIDINEEIKIHGYKQDKIDSFYHQNVGLDTTNQSGTFIRLRAPMIYLN